jgi:hypothetical protein
MTGNDRKRNGYPCPPICSQHAKKISSPPTKQVGRFVGKALKLLANLPKSSPLRLFPLLEK